MRSVASRPGRGVRAAAAVVALAAALAVPAGAGAQQFLASNRFNFDFSNPGARSLGFGGAFAGLADDATAAFANPAGLVQLTRPEVSLEVRSQERSPSFIAGGRFDGEPTGRGVDTVSGVAIGRDESSVAGPSFAAVVLPRGRWSFAVYGHQLSRFEIATASQGFFTDDPDAIPPVRSPAFRERFDLEIVTGGVAAARRIDDRVSVGLALVHSDVSLDGAVDVFLYDFRDPGSAFEEIPFVPGNRLAAHELAVDDGGLTVQAGVLVRAGERLSAGFFFRQGVEAEGPARSRIGLFGEVEIDREGTTVFDVPDVWGLGLAYRSPGGAVTLAAEVDRVGYEGLLRLEFEDADEDTVFAEYRDAWQYHLGAEVALLRRRPIVAFRAGGWIQPEADLLGDDVHHLAAGLGFAAERFQVDLAADFSDEADVVSASLIWGF